MTAKRKNGERSQQDNNLGNQNGSIEDIGPCALVEGPRWADAEFYGRWLLAAAKAEMLWREAYEDPSFSEKVMLVTMCCIPDFAIGATVLLSRFEKNLASVTVGLNRDDGEEFNELAMMCEMGFFLRTGERYQMVIPTDLNMETVKRAVLKFARTEDEDGCLRPESLVVTMPYAEARAWQSRLRRTNQARRLAERRTALQEGGLSRTMT